MFGFFVPLSLYVKRLAPGIERQRENKQQWFLSSTSFSEERGTEADSKKRMHEDKNTKKEYLEKKNTKQRLDRREVGWG